MGQIEVGEDEIPVLVGDPLESDDRVGNVGHVEAAALAKHVAGETRRGGIVLDDKDSSWAGGRAGAGHAPRLFAWDSRRVRRPVAGWFPVPPAGSARGSARRRQGAVAGPAGRPRR